MKKLICSLVCTFVLVLALGGCSNSAKEDSVIKLGINGEVNSIWKGVQSRLADEGIELQFVTFSDYILPNQALAQGEIDANSFQTIAYFEKFIADHELDLTSIGNTVLAPMAIYSAKVKDLTELKEKAKVSI
ncbi:MAG: MetQ/NlpA family ABC transporter substrate-binding protein, partial [Turicibacter sp.]